uniref:TLC domain-containing protein n=1 Tax=Parastrongyloides trichosuri TaxID=131310 RepID=A0A0N4ZG02_PARTI
MTDDYFSSTKTNLPKDGSLTSQNIQLISMTVFSFTFFRILTYLVRWYFFKSFLFKSRNYFESTKKSKEDGKYFLHIQHNKKWRISNECISCFHASLCSFWLLYLFLKYLESLEDFLIIYEHMIGMMFAFIFGYIISDTVDLVANEWSIRIIILLFHHTLVSISTVYPMITKTFGGVICIGFLMELNSILLHVRSLLNYNGINKKNIKFKMVAMANMFTFIIFRIIPNIYLAVFCIRIIKKFQWYVVALMFLVIYGLLITNIILMYRLLTADGFIKVKKPKYKDGFDIETDANSNYNSIILEEMSFTSDSSTTSTQTKPTQT